MPGEILTWHRKTYKSEIRSSKSETNSIKQLIQIRQNQKRDLRYSVWNITLFDHLDLFRISGFEFRVFCLALLGTVCASADGDPSIAWADLRESQLVAGFERSFFASPGSKIATAGFSYL
jgi:hypothetical protein